jgi:predicted cobalt transporter CbtA
MEDILDATGLALAWDAEDHQAALYNATRAAAADYNANTVYSATNEITGTGYTAGGVVVTGTAFTRPGSGLMKFSSNAFQWASSTLSGVAHIDVYAAAVAADPLMFGITISPVNTSDGTLLVTPHSNGLVTFDLTPA